MKRVTKPRRKAPSSHFHVARSLDSLHFPLPLHLLRRLIVYKIINWELLVVDQGFVNLLTLEPIPGHSLPSTHAFGTQANKLFIYPLP